MHPPNRSSGDALIRRQHSQPLASVVMTTADAAAHPRAQPFKIVRFDAR
jgi:hypothetical protein